LYRCPAQPDPLSTVPNVFVCHYVLTFDRQKNNLNGDDFRWELHDREQLSEDGPHEPWYIGPEITFAEQAILFATKKGPHSAGEFYTNTGRARGLE
jgi:hypothetical protein